MSPFPPSRAQIRLMGILKMPVGADYYACRDALWEAGYRGDAIPLGWHWRHAAMVSDAKLVAATRVQIRWEPVMTEVGIVRVPRRVSHADCDNSE